MNNNVDSRKRHEFILRVRHSILHRIQTKYSHSPPQKRITVPTAHFETHNFNHSSTYNMVRYSTIISSIIYLQYVRSYLWSIHFCSTYVRYYTYKECTTIEFGYQKVIIISKWKMIKNKHTQTNHNIIILYTDT